MTAKPGWHFDESRQVGTDYTDDLKAAEYDSKMRKIRNTDRETTKIAEALGINGDQTILEIGCGTGDTAIGLSYLCRKVIAVDISGRMLQYARTKAESGSVTNISFVNAGFLSYEHEGDPLDAVVTQLALHHLPDFWKLIALKKINMMLRDGGLLYLKDVVFSIQIEKYTESIEYWINHLRETAGEDVSREAEIHLREEFSTYDWIMEEMLYRSGFYIETADYMDHNIAVYVCRKTADRKK